MSRYFPDSDEKWAIRRFPGLAGKFDKTSLQTDDYNCLAWALERTHHWIDPFDHQIWPGKYWPPGIPEDWTIVTTRLVLEQEGGYTTEAATPDLEPEWEKVAIFSNSSGDLHFARQLPNGQWTSKLGEHIDIAHDDLECLKGNSYGEWRVILKRRRNQIGQTAQH
jgi:hypothetical protein